MFIYSLYALIMFQLNKTQRKYIWKRIFYKDWYRLISLTVILYFILLIRTFIKYSHFNIGNYIYFMFIESKEFFRTKINYNKMYYWLCINLFCKILKYVQNIFWYRFLSSLFYTSRNVFDINISKYSGMVFVLHELWNKYV